MCENVHFYLGYTLSLNCFKWVKVYVSLPFFPFSTFSLLTLVTFQHLETYFSFSLIKDPCSNSFICPTEFVKLRRFILKVCSFVTKIKAVHSGLECLEESEDQSLSGWWNTGSWRRRWKLHTQTMKEAVYLRGAFPGPPEQHGLNSNTQLQSQLNRFTISVAELQH